MASARKVVTVKYLRELIQGLADDVEVRFVFLGQHFVPDIAPLVAWDGQRFVLDIGAGEPIVFPPAADPEPGLIEALVPFAEEGKDLTELPCHAGLTTVEACGRCSLVLAARAALACARGER